MGKPIENLVGKTFGRYLVLSFIMMNSTGKSIWKCRCACGTEKNVDRGSLLRDPTVSCGCKKKEHLLGMILTHGLSKTDAYKSWENMRRRCNDTNFSQYKDYGGRGIKVCERWDNFSNFFEDLGERPEGLTLDRINVNSNYEPSNCKWSTRSEQQFNRRKKNVQN